MDKKKILILGAKGLLGTVLVKSLSTNSQFKIVTHSQTSEADFKSDLADYEAVRGMLQEVNADFCINLVALTDVNLCESDREKAYRLNVSPIKNIVKSVLSENLKLKLIHISTDHVYDQQDATEDDIKLVNYYAFSKYLADEFSQLMAATVLRTNFFGQSSSSKASFSDWIIQSLKDNKPISGFTDVFFSPLHLSSLVAQIERVILNFKPGVYNLGSKSGLSKYQFMNELAKHKGFAIDQIGAIKYIDSSISVPRPFDMRMSVSKYEKAFGVTLPTLLEEIHKC